MTSSTASGVLHHLPDPERGVRQLPPLLRQNGKLFVWLYSRKRPILNFILECVRTATTRLPHPTVRHLAWMGAAVDRGVFVEPYRSLRKLPSVGPVIDRLTPQRIKLYSTYPFQVVHADWFDRLAAPIRHYYDEAGARQFLLQAGLRQIVVSPTGLYGWRACGAWQRDPSKEQT